MKQKHQMDGAASAHLFRPGREELEGVEWATTMLCYLVNQLHDCMRSLNSDSQCGWASERKNEIFRVIGRTHRGWK
jgi:hypothetical protein